LPRLTAILLESQMTVPLKAAAAAAAVELDIFLLHDMDEAALRHSVGRADAVFGGVLTLDAPVAMVATVLREVRPPAVVFFHSQVEALALSRIGDFDAAGPAWREAAAALRQAGVPLPGLLNVVLAALPQVEAMLPPGRFAGLRAYARASRLWADGTVASLTALMQFLTTGSAVDVASTPQVGLWHPRGGAFATLEEYRAWYGAPADRPAVGVVVHRRWVAGGNAAHFAAVIERLEARGLAVYAGYSDLDATPLVERYFVPAGVECLLNLVSFNLVGGHGRPDPARAVALLERLDRPYLCAVPLVLQSLEQWRASRMGLAPHQTVMQVVMPELEGGAEPWVYAGQGEGDAVVADPDLADWLARRVRRWVDLRRAPRAGRRVAVTLFSMPPDKGSVGSAAYLDVFESLYRLMERLKAEGYAVDLPASPAALRLAVLGADTALPGADSIPVAGRLSAADYRRLVPHWPRIARCWGAPPGLLETDGRDLLIRGRAFGNLFVGVQPSFGYEGDPMRLLFHPDASPSHAFAAYYAWVERVWGAHALLHFGTHGALEFMPGRQTGLGADDFPAALLGDLPHFYFYSLNNPSEASIAKRRGGAVILSHLTPPLAQAGLYRALSVAREATRAYQHAPSDEALEVVRDLARAADLDGEVPPGEGYVERLSAYLLELETRLIPVGLHVAGSVDGLEETARAAASLRGVGPDDPVVQDLLRRAAASDELGALVAALDGRYVSPAPGGDPVRNPEVLPAGRNIHALNPWSVPSAVAVRMGKTLADQLLERMGRVPESVALVLWGTDNIKTQGEAVAQALWLLGAVPGADSLGRMSRVRLVPLAELGRPRVDVVMTCSGIFRDLFPSVMQLLDQAVLAAATADEPPDQNFVRKRALAMAAELGLPLAEAARRVFASQAGQYGTGVNHVVQESAWETTGEIGQVYLERMAFAHGRGDDAPKARAVLRAALAGVETAVQHMDSVELGLADIDHYFEHLGGVVAAVEALGGRRPEAFVIDTATAGSKPRLLAEALRIESRTRLLNPRWYEGMLAHGYQGVHEIAQRLDHTYGWQATVGAVDGWVFTGAARVLREQAERMQALNPRAVHRMADRLLEAHNRGLWEGPADDVAALHTLRDGVEAMMEGIA
jgi:magnesium chelatase subunit H